MSALVGLYHRDGGPVQRAVLEAMAECLAHRGPDSVGLWVEGAVGLGQRLLWTTPESVYERLPLVSDDGQLVLTADARLDNRADLIAALGGHASPPGMITDSHLILAAYERWGDQCVRRLRGDFAFAIWDSRRQRLFCARDHFGVRPFYYYLSERLFACATEIKALLRVPGVPRRLNERRVAAYLASLGDDPAATLYEGIVRLPPAHTLTVSRDALQLNAYWSLDPTRELRLASDADYAEALRALFTEAVRCRLRSAFPVGAMLSGGLDSSSIACTAQRLLRENGGGPLHTFSAVFDHVKECDERPFIQAVLDQKGMTPHVVHADSLGPWLDLEQVLWSQDEAVRTGNLYYEWRLYQMAQASGVRVILDGFDGDSTISHGLGYLAQLANSGQWLTLAREVIAYSRRTHAPWASAVWAWFWKYGLEPALPRSRAAGPLRRLGRAVYRQAMRQQGSGASAADFTKLLRPDFVRRLDLPARSANGRVNHPTERQAHYDRLTEPGMPATLEVLGRAAGAFGIELRFPFWDIRLVEFCLSLPPEQKIRQGWTRYVMRGAMQGVLPPSVQWRPGKSDMHPGFEYGLWAHEQARLDRVMDTPVERLAPYVDMTVLRQAYARYRSRRPTEFDVNAVWRAASLALWLEHTELRAARHEGCCAVGAVAGEGEEPPLWVA